jgi:hypothetical protein
MLPRRPGLGKVVLQIGFVRKVLLYYGTNFGARPVFVGVSTKQRPSVG